MDPRVVLGPQSAVAGVSDAFMLRNAGGRVTDDVIRSLVLCTHLLDVTEIGVLQHTDCRLHGRTNDELTQLTGVAVDFLPVLDPVETLTGDVNRLRTCGLFGSGVSIWGGLYRVEDQTTRVLVPPSFPGSEASPAL